MIRFSSVFNAFRRGGLDEVGRRLYLRTRALTPPVRRVRLSGVPTGQKVRLGDLLARRAWAAEHLDNPLYESALTARLREHVRPGDHVVAVGGGNGVTAVVAAQAAGPGGQVDVYEASDDMLGPLRGTLATNGVSGRVRVHHAIVGEAHDVWGETSARVVAPTALPPCDVLMLDCEGAEREVLSALTHRPRVLLVETHGTFGAPTADMRALIEAAGYRVLSDEIAEAGLVDLCEAWDVHVLSAVLPSARS